MTIDEADHPFFSGSTASAITLGGHATSGTPFSLIVAQTDPTCTTNCLNFTSSRILCDGRDLLVAYLGNDQVLRLRGFGKDDVRTAFDPTSSLIIKAAGRGAGNVTASPAGVQWTKPIMSYPDNTMVTLAAVPATGSVFTGWGGDCQTQTPTCQLTLKFPGGAEATANFSLISDMLPPSWRHIFP
ncbi:hypothetical protein [uncultured Thiodictyon sp.]|uniref:InlB B-repeat-containing protein n=1 Tax=uncultured Thiodictyon sp. TaxID=1846217 RepID=UPI0025ED2708|nr:hypothetical protein [uncultured Thiodictyon sp.]